MVWFNSEFTMVESKKYPLNKFQEYVTRPVFPEKKERLYHSLGGLGVFPPFFSQNFSESHPGWKTILSKGLLSWVRC